MAVDGWSVRPLLLAVESDPERLGRTETELARSFGPSYRVRGEISASDAVRLLEGAHERGERVALVLVDDRLPASERDAVVTTARSRHPAGRIGRGARLAGDRRSRCPRAPAVAGGAGRCRG